MVLISSMSTIKMLGIILLSLLPSIVSPILRLQTTKISQIFKVVLHELNYTDRETSWIYTIEQKQFKFDKDEEGNDFLKTVKNREYSSEWKIGDEPYYSVNDGKKGELYKKYK